LGKTLVRLSALIAFYSLAPDNEQFLLQYKVFLSSDEHFIEDVIIFLPLQEKKSHFLSQM
jgi:hypothetical protein